MNHNYHYSQRLNWPQLKTGSNRFKYRPFDPAFDISFDDDPIDHKPGMTLNEDLRKAMLKEWPFLGEVVMTGNLKIYMYPAILLLKGDRFKKLKDGEEEMKCESLKGEIYSIPYNLLTCEAIQVAEKLIGEAIVRSYGG